MIGRRVGKSDGESARVTGTVPLLRFPAISGFGACCTQALVTGKASVRVPGSLCQALPGTGRWRRRAWRPRPLRLVTPVTRTLLGSGPLALRLPVNGCFKSWSLSMPVTVAASLSLNPGLPTPTLTLYVGQDSDVPRLGCLPLMTFELLLHGSATSTIPYELCKH